MIDVFRIQKKFVSDFEIELFQELKRTINAFDFVLKDMIVNKQLFRDGIDGNGNKLAGYARTTIRIKLAKNHPVDRTTTRDEGLFHALIEVTGTQQSLVITSDVSYDKWIVKRYGRNILKLTPEHIREFMIKYFLPNLKQHVRKLAK